MGFMNSWGAATILLLCGLLFAGIFGFFPLPYVLSTSILKIDSRSYWKAFGLSLLGIIVVGLLGWLANLGVKKWGMPEYTLLIVLTVLHFIVISALIIWIYQVRLIKALLIWLVALPFNLVIAGIIVFIIWYGLGMPMFGILKGMPATVP